MANATNFTFVVATAVPFVACICHVSQTKGTITLVFSVLVADLGLQQVLCKMLTLAIDFYMNEHHPRLPRNTGASGRGSFEFLLEPGLVKDESYNGFLLVLNVRLSWPPSATLSIT
jgi:hypothetical protein